MGSVIIIPGFYESYELYLNHPRLLDTFLKYNNLNIFIFDHWGQGHSIPATEGNACAHEVFSHYVDDFRDFISAVKLKYPDAFNEKTVLFTHLAGSLVALEYMQSSEAMTFDRILMIAPLPPSYQYDTPLFFTGSSIVKRAYTHPQNLHEYTIITHSNNHSRFIRPDQKNDNR